MTEKQLKNTILQEAITGRLVPQDPNDEPASVLLERIREEKKRLVKEGKLKKKDLVETPISEDEKPFDIPDSWEWVRIPDIGISQLGKTKNPHQLSGKNMPYLCSINVYWEGINLSQTKEMMFEESEIDKYTIKKGDLLICEGGDCGRSTIWDNDSNILYQNALHRVRFFCDIDSKYILYCIYLYKTTNQLDDYIKGETIKHLVKGELDSILFPLPPLAEQKRIVAKIEELMPKVEEYGKAQDALDKLNNDLPERLKKSMLQEAITGRLVPQDPNDEPASALLERIREEKKRLVKEGKLKKKDLVETPISEEDKPFDIPESWEWVKFGEIVSTSTGKTPARGDVTYWGSNDYPWVSISDMKQGAIIDSTKEFISEKAAKSCFQNKISKKGTLIMSFKLTVGRTSILGIDAYHNEAIVSIKPYVDNDNYTRDYLAHILPIVANAGDSKDAIKGKTLNAKSIYNLIVPLPPLAEQKRIVAKIEELMKEIDKLKA